MGHHSFLGIENGWSVQITCRFVVDSQIVSQLSRTESHSVACILMSYWIIYNNCYTHMYILQHISWIPCTWLYYIIYRRYRKKKIHCMKWKRIWGYTNITHISNTLYTPLTHTHTHTFVYSLIRLIYTYIHIYIHTLYTHTHICIHSYTHSCTHIHLHTHIHIHTLYTHTHIHTFVYSLVHSYTLTHTYTYIHCTLTHTYTYIRILISRRQNKNETS